MTTVVEEPGGIVVVKEVPAAEVVEVNSPGPKGDKGDTGDTGSQGLTGATGATGATGPQGPTGPVSSVSGTAPIQVTTGASTPVVSIDPATGTDPGSMSAADKTKLDAISGTNTGDETAARIGTLTADATAKTTPVDADSIGLSDSAAGNALKKFTWANLKAAMFAAWGALIGAGTGKTTPVNADALAIMDSAASNATKTLTWANVKATLKTYFDTLYASLAANGSEVIQRQVAGSAWTSIDFTLPSTYNDFEVFAENILPTTNSVNLLVQLKIGGVWVTSGYYWANWRWTVAGNGVIGQSGVGAGIALNAAGADNMAFTGDPAAFWIKITNCAQATRAKRVSYEGAYTGSAPLNIRGNGISSGTGAVTDLRLIFDSGTGQAGTIATLRGSK